MPPALRRTTTTIHFSAPITRTGKTVRRIEAETTDPDTAPDCLGPEATEFLTELIPPGTEVRLEHDEELQDRYERYLAGVFLDDVLVNAEIARQGLGVAILFEPNSRFYDEVAAGQEEARLAERGLYDPEIECTVPALLEEFNAASAAVGEAPDTSAPLDALADHAAEIAAALATGAAISELLDSDATGFPSVVLAHADLSQLRRSHRSATADLEEEYTRVSEAIQQERRRLVDERRAAAAAQRAEEERRAAEEARREEEEAAREAQREAERRAQEEARQQEERQREQERRQQSSGGQSGSTSSGSSGSSSSSGSGSGSGSSGSSSSGSSGGSDDYTGCRAYSGLPPNAVDSQGRPYTKIDCTTKLPIG